MRDVLGIGARILEHRWTLVLGGLAAGLLWAAAGVGPRLGAAVCAAAALAAGAALRRAALGVAVAAAVLAGALAGHARLAALDRSELGPLLGRSVELTAVILEAPRERSFGGWSAPARIVDGPGEGERILVRADGEPRGGARRDGTGEAGAGGGASALEIGTEVRLRGRLDGLGPFEAHEARRGAHAALDAVAVARTGRRRGGLAGAVDAIRQRAERGVSAGLAPPQAALARGMVLGQDDALDEETRDEFRASGLAHVLAASGQNVTLLALLATWLLGIAGAPRRSRLAAALALIALYVPLAGAGPSIQRAGIMGAAGLVAALAGRAASRAHAVLLAAAATLLLSPRAAGDPGWQLSFAAIIAIALLAPRLRDALVDRRIPRPVAEAAALTTAATLGTAPLLALHFGQVSLAALPANVVAAPALAPVVWLGTVSGTLAQLGSPVAPILGALNAVAALPLGFVGAVAAAAAAVPGATVPLELGAAGLAAAYAALATLAASARARAIAAGAAAALAVAALAAPIHIPPAPSRPTITFLDVGQGDATLLQEGETAILVDTGPADGPILDRLRAAGVRRLDLLVLTHAQADHDGATAAILDALPVGAVLDGGIAAPPADRPGDERPAARAIAERGARRLIPRAGQTIAVGAFALEVLWPPASPAPAGSDPNARATVLHVRHRGIDALLAADAESPVLLALDLPRAEILKVAHHGSADPGLPALLARVRPRLAAIEVGEDNPYGHPHPTTLAALDRAVPRVVRTDRHGTVAVPLTG